MARNAVASIFLVLSINVRTYPRCRPCESRDPYAVPDREDTAYGSRLHKRVYARLRRAVGQDDPESEGTHSTSLYHALGIVSGRPAADSWASVHPNPRDTGRFARAHEYLIREVQCPGH